ncbi:MAG: TonB-dependent receptor [Alphaproteobacteria bacterium]|nr:TonB-dependent receptor [Alphaproteobacteria bacterium]
MLVALIAAWAAEGRLSGRVVDGDGIPVPAAGVSLSGPASLDLTADPEGRFTVVLEEGDWEVRVDHPGFVASTWPVTIAADAVQTTSFTIVPLRVEQVVVRAETRPWRDVQRGERAVDPTPTTGLYELTRRDVESTPGALEDVARAAHALPGVVSDGDLFAGFHVRGGEQGDVVFLLDRVPLENPFHLAGFNSLFNPDMVRSVRFFAGAAPAEVPSATSAVLDVSTWDGTRVCAEDDTMCGGLDGSVDLSASSARVFLTGPLDRREKLTFALAARRTYMEGYFAVLKALNVVDSAFVAPGFDELSGRLAWHPDARHRVMLSVVRASDRLGLIDSDDDAAIAFDGAFELETALTLTSLDHRFVGDDGTRVQTTLAWTRDRAYSNRELERDTLRRETVLNRLFARSDAVIPFGPNARLKVGADASRFEVDAIGSIQDQRIFPRWTQAGIGAFGFQVADVDGDPSPWPEANAYVQTEIAAPFGKPREGSPIVPGVQARAGIRVTYTGLADEVLASPRAGLSLPLPTGTVPKVTLGLYQRVLRDPFQLAPGFGNPDLTAERARHLVVGIDQGFPLPGGGKGGLVRVEGYDIALADLVVNPDTEAGLADGAFRNVGSGASRGVDVMIAARGGRLNGELVYGLLYTRRHNPLNTVFTQDIAPPQDQRHTFSVAGDWAPVPRWRVTGRYTFHSGRPLSEVRIHSLEFEDLEITCLNCARIGPTHSLDLRGEWRKAFRRYRLAFYVEVLNVGNVRSRFLPIHDVIDGELSTSWLNHLPMRPFLGMRADF